MLSSVDLPDPDGPTMDTYSPRSTRRFTSLRAETSTSPVRYVRWMPSSSRTGSAAVSTVTSLLGLVARLRLVVVAGGRADVGVAHDDAVALLELAVHGADLDDAVGRQAGDDGDEAGLARLVGQLDLDAHVAVGDGGQGRRGDHEELARGGLHREGDAH